MAHSADMARLTVLLALLLSACVAGVARAAAVKGRLPITHPDFPQPLRPAEPCDIKRLPCVPVYSEEGARRLAQLGIMDQVAVDDSLDEQQPPPPPPPPAPSKRKTPPCRRGGDCRRKHKSSPSAEQRLQARQLL